MNLTSNYAPDAHGAPLADATVRLVAHADLPACAELIAHASGGEAASWLTRLQYRFDKGDPLFAAVVDGCVVGFASLTWLDPEETGGRGAPSGWYLSGIGVNQHFQRRGLGRALTQARCAWVWGQGQPVYFAVSASNTASLDLHRELGFRELTREFAITGLSFTDGQGVLFVGEPDGLTQQVVELRVAATGRHDA